MDIRKTIWWSKIANAKVKEKGHIYEIYVCSEVLAGGKEGPFCECSR